MKNYNKILEAIDRGILLALDDYDDTVLMPKKISNYDDSISTKDQIEIDEYFMDLELPSGTLWAKYNLGVDPHQLEYSHCWFGNLYAWGETKTKLEFIWTNYKHCNGSDNHLNKYCPNDKQFFWAWDFVYVNGKIVLPDNKLVLDMSDDAANSINKHWAIPTDTLYEELIEYTTAKYKDDYKNIVGLKGLEFTSKINGKNIFFPLSIYDQQLRSWYWTNKLSNNPKDAIAFYIDDFVDPNINKAQRSHGHYIRQVFK